MRRTAITVGFLLFLWGAYVEYVNYLVWDLAQSFGRQSPVAWALPTPLPDRTTAALSGPRLAGFGLSFQVPRQVTERGRQTKSIVVEYFADGGGMIFSPMAADTAKMWREGSGSGTKAIPIFLGPMPCDQTTT